MTNHYTPEQVAIDCISLLPIKKSDIVIDAGAGHVKVWYNNIPACAVSLEYEIEDGRDFLSHNDPVDWVIGNPPYKIGWDFLAHSSKIARKGIGFLHSLKTINSNFLPSRLDKMERAGFGITTIHAVNIAKWYGRYFFIIYEKDKPSIVSYNLKNYKE